MMQQPKPCGQRGKLHSEAKFESRRGGEQSSEHLLLFPRWVWTERMVTRDAGSAAGFRAAGKGLQTPHRHPSICLMPLLSWKGAPCAFKPRLPLKHYLHFLFQTVRPRQPLSSPCQRGDSMQGQGKSAQASSQPCNSLVGCPETPWGAGIPVFLSSCLRWPRGVCVSPSN